jgi:hypothetical protein
MAHTCCLHWLGCILSTLGCLRILLSLDGDDVQQVHDHLQAIPVPLQGFSAGLLLVCEQLLC